MKGMVAAVLIAMGLGSLLPAVQWGGWIIAGVLAVGLVKLWYSVPHTTNRELVEENQELRERVSVLEAHNQELNERDRKQAEEIAELKGQLRELREAFDRTAALVGSVQQELKELRALKDEQFMQWMKERAENGNL